MTFIRKSILMSKFFVTSKMLFIAADVKKEEIYSVAHSQITMDQGSKDTSNRNKRGKTKLLEKYCIHPENFWPPRFKIILPNC